MVTPVFLETSVVYTYAQHYDIGSKPFFHSEWNITDTLVSKLGVVLKGISTKYVIEEAIDSFNEHVSGKYKGQIPLELRDSVVSQFRTNIAKLEKRLEVHHLWSSSDPNTISSIKKLRAKVNSWYNSLLDSGLIEKQLEHSDRTILSESCYVRGLEGPGILQFVTRDKGFIKLRPLIAKEFFVEPCYPQEVKTSL